MSKFKPGDVVIRTGPDDGLLGMKKGGEYVVESSLGLTGVLLSLVGVEGEWLSKRFVLKQEEWIPKVGDLVTTEPFDVDWLHYPGDHTVVKKPQAISDVMPMYAGKYYIVQVGNWWWPLSALTRHDGVKPSGATPVQPKKKRRVYNEA